MGICDCLPSTSPPPPQKAMRVDAVSCSHAHLKQRVSQMAQHLSRGLLAVDSEIVCMGCMLYPLPILKESCLLSISLACTAEGEGVGRKEVSLAEEVERQHLLAMFHWESWHRRTEAYIVRTTSVLREAEQALQDTGTDYASLLSTMRTVADSRAVNPMTKNLRDVTMGIMSPLDSDAIAFSHADVLLLAVALYPDDVHVLVRLADYLPIGQQKWDLFKRCMEMDASWEVLILFAFAMRKTGSPEIVFPDGSCFGVMDLLMRAIEIITGMGIVYSNMGHCMEALGIAEVTLRGEVMSPEMIYKRALSYSPELPQPYTDLGACLHGESTTLEDGTVMTKDQLYKRSISVALSEKINDSATSRCYSNLANSLPDGGATTLEDGTVMTQEELYKRAISIDPDFSNAYNNLGTCIPYGGTTRLENGTVMTKEEVFRKAVELNPNNSCAEENLSDCERYAEYKRLSTGSGGIGSSRS